MALNLEQQIKEAINRSRQILVVFRQNGGQDAVATALALAAVLKKQGKQVEVASESFQAPAELKFISKINEIKPQLSPLQKFIIKVDIAKNKLASLSYDVKDNQLYIYITPRQGLLNREDVKIASTDLKFDLIFVLDAPDWESLGRIYDNNTDLFFRTPSINIDHNPANEHFGKINLVDITATATSEIVFEFLNQTAPEQLTEEIATLLLTGLIAKTRSFKTANVTARTLTNASRLVELGAKREQIVQNLFRNRSVATLKLWGQILLHLKHEATCGLVWSTLSREDFQRAGAAEENLLEIIDELLSNAPEAKIIVLLYETEKNIDGKLLKQVEGLAASTSPAIDIQLLTKPFNPIGSNQRVKISLPDKDLVTAEAEVVENVKKMMGNMGVRK